MNAGVGISQEALVSFFGKLGYNPDTLQDEGITPPIVNLRDVYRQLPTRPDVVTRIERAIGVDGANISPDGRDATNEAYLADMAALVTNDPRWCEHIPQDLPLATQRAGFRDWCRFTIASNTKNPALCREIAIPASERDPRLSLQATCLFQTSSPYPSGKYGPEVPDDDRIRSIMPILGYPIPTAKDLPPYEIYTAYDRFLDELNRQADAKHEAARKRFVDRVLQLP
jgi:hypothetical protein